MKFIFYLFILFFSIVSFAQDLPKDTISKTRAAGAEDALVPKYPDVFMPAPETQKFMQYGNFGPSLATGTVNVPIPVYTIKVANYELPISFLYATNGIKVTDSPHPLGYGWLLQPACRISRVMMGRDDFHFPRDTRTYGEFEGTYRERFMRVKSFLKYVSDANVGDRPRQLDSRYDLFTVHLPNEKINFVIDQENGKWKVYTDGSLAKIDVTENKIKVLDQNGILYIFGSDNINDQNIFERRKNFTCDDPYIYISAWGLKEIVLPGNQYIRFEWISLGRINPLPTEIEEQNTICDFYSVPNQYDDMQSMNRHIGQKFNSPETVTNIALNKIIFPLGRIMFSYLDGKYKNLSKIEIRNDEKPVKIVNLAYNSACNLLTSMSMTGENKYRFEYDPNEFDYFTGYDFWGYYNGVNNQYTVPDFTIKTSIGDEHTFGGNRKVNEKFIQANILKKITYPTGGITTFEYELHEFSTYPIDDIKLMNKGLVYNSNENLSEGGGVRLKRMLTKESENTPTVIKTYKYGKPLNSDESSVGVNAGFDGLGIAPDVPTLDTFIDEKISVTNYVSLLSHIDGTSQLAFYTNRVVNIGSRSNINEYMFLYPSVWYDRVTEYVGMSKTVFEYEFPFGYDCHKNAHYYISGAALLYYIKHNLIYNYAWDLPEGESYFSKRYPRVINTVNQPNLKTKCIYQERNDKYDIVRKCIYEYVHKQHFCFRNLYVYMSTLNNLYPFLVTDAWTCQSWTEDSPHFMWGESSSFSPFQNRPGLLCRNPFPVDSEQLYTYEEYQLKLDRLYPSLETIEDYTENGKITKTVQSNYVDYADTKILKSQITSGSTGGNGMKEEYRYPFEDASGLPVEQQAMNQKMIENNRASTPVEIKRLINDQLVGRKVYTYNDYGNNLLLPIVEDFYTGTGNLGFLKYDNYNKFGNSLSITKNGCASVVYLWGYKGQYPVAEIKNTTYANVVSALGGEEFINSLASVIPSESDYAKINNLKNALPDAMITVYKYIPLVGVVEVADPRGVITYYNYDSFGRLKEVYRMENGIKQLLQVSDYHYGNE